MVERVVKPFVHCHQSRLIPGIPVPGDNSPPVESRVQH